MSTLMINDLPRSKDLNSKSMANVIGGCDYCGGYKKAYPGYAKIYCQPVYCVPVYCEPEPCYQPKHEPVYCEPDPCYQKPAHHPKYPPGSITIVDVF
jgi:hypothetical protein